MASTVKPCAISLVVCDNIYTEPSGKAALVGIFNSLSAHAFPVRHPRMAVFASLTGLRAGSAAKLDLIHSENDKIVFAVQGEFPSGHTPLTIIDMSFILNNVTFPDEGTYYMRFWANDHLLLQRPFQVKRIRPKGDKTNDDAR